MSKPVVLLLESVADPAKVLLLDTTETIFAQGPDQGVEAVAGKQVRGIVTRGKGQVDHALIDACPKLEVIARCGVGIDNIAAVYARSKGVDVINLPGGNAATVAEHTLALMLNLQRRICPLNAAVKSGDWQARNSYGGDEIRGKTLGIIGLGNIGSKVAGLAVAFGMNVIYSGRKQKSGGYERVGLNTLLSRADILSLHLPLESDTIGMIGAQALAKMKPGALIINTSRGGLVDEAALAHSLSSGQLGGYAADVMQLQPPAANHPLLGLPNVLLTPHAASLTASTYEYLCLQSVKNLLAILSGEQLDAYYIANH